MVICQLGLNMDQHGLNWNRRTFCTNSPAWDFTFYTLILVTDGQTLPPHTTLWFFSYFGTNVTRNFKNQGCLSVNYQLKMHTSLCKGRSNSPTATTDKEGEWLQTGDMTRLHSLRLRQGWKLIGCYQVQGQECHTIHFKREQMLLHPNSMHDNVMQLLCLLPVLLLRRLLARWMEYRLDFP